MSGSPPPLTVGISIGTTGPVPTPPSVLNATLISYVAWESPGYTILPGALTADLAGTATAAVALMDAAAVDLINSLTPFTSNPWLTNQLGNTYGVPQGSLNNTSVYVVFSSSAIGYVIERGFLVSDGSNIYQVQDGGAILSGGSTNPLFCVALNSGSFAVPAGTVTTLVSTTPGVTVTCTNPASGTPQAAPETLDEYRVRVLNAGKAAASGSQTFLKTQLTNVSGVQSRLVSVVQVDGGGWEVIVGGGDPYAVAYAIYNGLFDISTLVGSTTEITAATLANPTVITTDINHGFTNGQTGVVISGALGLTGINGTWTVTTTGFPPNQFSIAHNSTGGPAYTGGGIVTPNTRNESVNIQDYPDTYTIVFVVPPQQSVEVQLSWNTNSPNFVSATAVAQLGTTAIVNYVNSISVGQPINLFEMEQVFAAAISSLIPPSLISVMDWTISIDGVSTPPVSGTFLVEGDPESYFFITAATVFITQV